MNVDGDDAAPVLFHAHDMYDQSEGIRLNAAAGHVNLPGTPRRPPSKPPPSLLPSLLPSLSTYPCWFRMKRECSIPVTLYRSALVSPSWRLYRRYLCA